MKLFWTRLAIADLNRAYEFIAEENPSAAARVIDRIEQALAALRTHPLIGRPGRVEGTRAFVISGTPLIVPYRIKEKRIEILGATFPPKTGPFES